MEYSINKLAKMAGVSTRTLRYYDELGLLTPKRISSNGYRVYGQNEIDLLQHILFYRELDVPLDEIKKVIHAQSFDGRTALENHLFALQQKKERLDSLINNVKKSIETMKGEVTMLDKEKFEGFKQKLIDENEEKYGEEIRAKYGEETIAASNKKLQGMTMEQYAEIEKLTREVNETLKEAFLQGDPASELAQKACELHKKWLCYYWVNYTKEAHLGVTQMYVDDPRFTEYYDNIIPGCAVFLRDAVSIYCEKE